jgi:hypothetical protein
VKIDPNIRREQLGILVSCDQPDRDPLLQTFGWIQKQAGDLIHAGCSPLECLMPSLDESNRAAVAPCAQGRGFLFCRGNRPEDQISRLGVGWFLRQEQAPGREEDGLLPDRVGS